MPTKTLVILWLVLPLAASHNPCHYHPCHTEVPEPSSLVLVMGTAMIWAGWKLAQKASKGGD